MLYKCIYPLVFRFFPHIGHYRVLSRAPVLYSRFLWIICFVYSTVYMSVPISQLIPPPLSPLVTISLFSTFRYPFPNTAIFIFYEILLSFHFLFTKTCLQYSLWVVYRISDYWELLRISDYTADRESHALLIVKSRINIPRSMCYVILTNNQNLVSL